MALSLIDLAAALPGDDPNNAITVTGQRPKATTAPALLPRIDPQAADIAPPPPRPLGNRDAIMEGQNAENTTPQRKGLFGIHGTLRDILGTLGDAFLLQAGRAPIYAPKRDQERMGEAMAGFTTDDPNAVKNAAERLAYQGFGTQAETLVQNQAENEIKLKTLEEYKNATLAEQMQKNADARYTTYGRIFSQYAGSVTAENYKQFKPLLQMLKQRGGLGDEYTIPDQFDGNIFKAYQYGGMPTYNQVSVPIAQENADAHMKNANRPQAPHTPRSQTDLEYFQQVSRVPEGERSPEEKQWMQKYLTAGRSNRFNGIAPPPASTPAAKSNYRIIKIH